jgi:hypothetical protein
MPTFLILKGSTTVSTIRGANPPALRSAILSASAEAAKLSAKSASGTSSGASFTSSGGRVLGTGAPPKSGGGGSMLERLGLGKVTGSSGGSAGNANGVSVNVPGGVMGTVTRFVGLYLTTLLSFDALKAAEGSPLAVRQAGR